MTQFDLDTLLAPIDDASPAGPDLEYDPQFSELERAATPKAERSIGDTVKAAEEPDWGKVAPLAQAFFARSKDLRAANHLAAAWTRTEGLAGWTAGLALVRALLDNYWEGVHPQLDAEDNNDPTARANALMPLGDPQSLLGYFRSMVFVQSPRLGRFTLRDLRIASGALSVEPSANARPLPTMVELEACCMDCDAELLPTAATLLAQALDHAQALDALLAAQLGTLSPDLSRLVADVQELKKFVDAQLARRFPELAAAAAQAQAAADADAAAGAQPSADAQAAAAEPARARGIQNSEDVLLRIDEICEYYDRNEPSSPVPILLRRARRLVGKGFEDVLRNIAPGGLSELQMLLGPDAD
ncbi:hypothetical protein GCM10027093_65270 [Paraburkholderia jirisanensis]